MERIPAKIKALWLIGHNRFHCSAFPIFPTFPPKIGIFHLKSCNTLQHFFIIETPLNSVSIQKINRKSKQFLARCRNSDGKYISATFKTRSEAEDFIAQNKKESLLPAELRISPLERADFARIKLICERYGKTIKDAASIIEEYLKNKKESTPPVFDAVKLFLDACEKRRVNTKVSGF